MNSATQNTLSFLVSPLFLICIFIFYANPGQAQSIADQGRVFLKESLQRENVEVTESGLQYLIIKPGNELRAGKYDKVKVHYQGKHVNGATFEDTFGDKPVEFQLNRVIKGWTEGLQLIGEGGRIILLIPPELAYGKRGSKPLIQRNETLIFIIDLLKVISEK